MVLFEIYQRFKSHFLNELRVSSNVISVENCFIKSKSTSSFKFMRIYWQGMVSQNPVYKKHEMNLDSSKC